MEEVKEVNEIQGNEVKKEKFVFWFSICTLYSIFFIQPLIIQTFKTIYKIKQYYLEIIKYSQYSNIAKSFEINVLIYLWTIERFFERLNDLMTKKQNIVV